MLTGKGLTFDSCETLERRKSVSRRESYQRERQILKKKVCSIRPKTGVQELSQHISVTDITEKELETYLVSNPSQIKEGLMLLRQQFPTDSGPLDMLVVDESGTICVVELKVQADEGHLNQGLRYYDYIRTNIDAIARSFKAEEHDVNAEAEPGLILISTEFSESLMRIIKYVSVPVELFRAIPIALPSGEKQAVCQNIEFGAPYDSPTIPTLEGNLAYIAEDSVRQVCKEILQDLGSRGVDIRPVKNFWFTLRKDGKLFLSLGCKRKFFSVYAAISEEHWSERIRIATRKEWEERIEPAISWLFSEETR